VTAREPPNWADSLAPRWPQVSALLDEALALSLVERAALALRAGR